MKLRLSHAHTWFSIIQTTRRHTLAINSTNETSVIRSWVEGRCGCARGRHQVSSPQRLDHCNPIPRHWRHSCPLRCAFRDSTNNNNNNSEIERTVVTEEFDYAQSYRAGQHMDIWIYIATMLMYTPPRVTLVIRLYAASVSYIKDISI